MIAFSLNALIPTSTKEIGQLHIHELGHVPTH